MGNILFKKTMNHLKFRIWDRALEQWVEPYSTGLHAFTEVHLTLDGRVNKFDAGFPSAGGEPLFSKASGMSYVRNKWWSATERYVVQQFTGIKDIDGKDIYEGDLLNGHYFGFNGNETDNTFENGQVMRSEWATFGIQARGWLEFCETSHFDEPCLKVVGNIFKSL
jgi:hypothetical protein